MAEVQISCSKCGKRFPVETVSSVNTARDPGGKERILRGELFVRECPYCGQKNLATFPLLYHDPAAQLMIWLSDGDKTTEQRMRDAVEAGGMEGYTLRIADTPGQLIEKIKIFDAGLDDVVMEMCKFVTRQELGKDADLLFFGIGGADHEITLTYPENGEMQLIRTGFNVYEDCAGIVSRNPALKQEAATLCRVNRAWMEQHLR